MKNTIKRGLCVIIVITLLFGSVGDLWPVFDMNILSRASGSNYYLINNVAVSCSSVEDPGLKQDWEYTNRLYEKVWGVRFSDDFSSFDNILKNLSSEDLTLNPSNLETYISWASPGAVLRISAKEDLYGKDVYGFNFFIVQTDRNGFTVFERVAQRQETYYTWAQFCNIYNSECIKYIKWPNSYYSTQQGTPGVTDYKKPSRTLYYDPQGMLYGNDVRWVQKGLSDLGYSISIDGYYSARTKQTVESFQAEFSLSVNGIVDAATADMLEKPLKKPDPPVLTLLTDKDMSLGETLSLSWSSVPYAEEYSIFLLNNRGQVVDSVTNTSATKASFLVNTAGTYSVKAVSANAKYNSQETVLGTKIRVHNTVTVTFVNDDGTVLNKQTIAYGTDAMTPASPRKKGFSFAGWDNTYVSVKKSLVVQAQYVKKTYTVTFVDVLGNTICSQKVPFGEAAIAPATENTQGFLCWNKDFSCVEEPMTVKMVAITNDAELPIQLSNATAVREEGLSGYSVNFLVRNYSEKRITGRAIVSLKTTSGKFLTLTESSAFSLPGVNSETGTVAERTIKVFVPYDKAATVAEIFVVENYRVLIPISEAISVTDIQRENDYSDWLPEEPENHHGMSSPRTEYSHRIKSTRESPYPTLAGWTFDYSTWIWSAYGPWIGNSTNFIAATEYIEVVAETETNPTGYNAQWWRTQSPDSPFYRHYWNYNRGPERASYGQYYENRWFPLATFDSMPVITANGGLSSGIAAGYNKANAHGRASATGEIWFNYETTTQTITRYRYRERTKIYTYHFHQWSDWSEYSPTLVVPTDKIEVRTRQTRQYLMNDPTECNDGVPRTITGFVDPSLSGKQATLFIYKIGEAADYTNEFVGQTVIGEDGSYLFNFKLREEPSFSTGDFTVTLGIEGTNTIIYFENIKAPVPSYTVNICDYDGSVINAQQVKRGESAVLPAENPQRVGYIFAGWDYSNASIYEDTNITAIYVPREYVVVFIDWTNERFDMHTYRYGEPLITPDMTNPEEYDAIGWEGVVAGMTVTQNMVITAKYEKKTFTVKFYDYDKNVIAEKQVEYGQAVEVPALESNEEHIFLSWAAASLNCVTTSMDVYPDYFYARTVETPVSGLASGIYGSAKTITLACATPGAVIYYAINGGEEQVYTGPITIEETAKIDFYAAKEGYNDSESAWAYYIINETGNQSAWKYPVTIYEDGVIVGLYIVDAGSTLEGEGQKLTSTSPTPPKGYAYASTSYSEWGSVNRSTSPIAEIFNPYHPSDANHLIRCVTTKTIPVGGYKTQWNYWRYSNSSNTASTPTSGYNGWTYYFEYGWRDTPLPNQGKLASGVPCWWADGASSWNVWYGEWTRQVQVQQEEITVWDYQDRTPTYTYIKNAREGYELEGYYLDAEYTQRWNTETDIIGSGTVLYAKWRLKEYAVTFAYENGEIISEQTVPYLEAAEEPPLVDVPDGMVFAGWDTDEYLCVTENKTINAVIKNQAEFAQITFNRTAMVMMSGLSYTLSATVSPAEYAGNTILWNSDNTGVVTVDNYGMVTAKSAGQAIISACVSNAEQAVAYCEITVIKNPSEELCLAHNSNLWISYGTLRGVLPGANRADAIKANFNASELLIVNSEGTPVKDDDFVGTCSMVCLTDNTGAILDHITVVVVGDLNNDGRVNNKDVAILTRFLVGKETLNDHQRIAADVNADGNINNMDASRLARYLVGKDVLIP